MLVCDSKSRCTSDSTLTVTCYKLLGDSGSRWPGESAMIQRAMQPRCVFTKCSPSATSAHTLCAYASARHKHAPTARSSSVTCSAASSCSSVSDTAVQPTGGEGAGSTPVRARRSRTPVGTACLIAATALPFTALLFSASSAAADRYAKPKTPRSLGDILGSSSGQGVCLF